MEINIEWLATELSGTSDARYYAALPAVANAPAGTAAGLLLLFLNGLSENSALPELKKSHRITGVIRAITLDASGWSRVVDASGNFPAGMRNTLAQYLPPRHKRSLTQGSARELVSLAVGPIHAESTAEQPPERSQGSAEVECSTVIILAREHTQASNRSLLKQAGYAAYVWDSPVKLKEDLGLSGGDVCGFLLDYTVLGELPEDAQREVIGEIASYSSFAWIRIDERGLLLQPHDVEQIVEAARCLNGRVAAHALSIRQTGDLTETELGYLRRCRESLLSHRMVAFVPAEIDLEQARLLIAAAREYAREQHFALDLKIESLETRFFQEGAEDNESSIAFIRVNRAGRTIVAKIAKRCSVVDEITRFRHYIQPWDNQLHPQVFFHGAAALILFALVPVRVASDEPAPVLSKSLGTAWNDEIFNAGGSSDESLRREIYLSDAVRSAALALESLNSQSPRSGPSPTIDPSSSEGMFQSLENRGLTWDFSEDVRVCRRKAATRFQMLRHSAIIHGDLHLKNILVRGNEDVHLIDYAASGPGHPATDLVRFELALMLGAARHVISEHTATALQVAFTLDRAGDVELRSSFPGFYACRLNRIVMVGCLAARDAALKVLAVHGGSVEDYVAAKYLVAWQNLLMNERQTMMARSIIQALTPAISNWPALPEASST